MVQGDVVTTVDGEAATDRLMKALIESQPSETVEVTIERTARGFGLLRRGGRRTLEVTAAQLLRGLTRFDGEMEPEIFAVTDDVAKATGLQRKDTIVEIDGQPATMSLLREIADSRRGHTVPIKVRRPEIGFGLIQNEEILDAEIVVGTAEMIGVAFDTKMVFRRAAGAEILPEAWRQSYRVTAQIGAVLSRLVTGNLSPKNALGGPVMIYEVSTYAARTSIAAFLDVMAMISINLGLLNLLPIPVLDGGQLLFLGVEAVRRKPVSIRFMEVVQQVGIVLLIGFMVYVTFNDVSRWVSRLIP